MQGGIKHHFWVFSMTRPGIEPSSPRTLANTLVIIPMGRYIYIYFITTLRGHCSFPRTEPLYPWSLPLMLNVMQGGIKHHFWVFSMTRPGIEPSSPRTLANTLVIIPMGRYIYIYIYIYISSPRFTANTGFADTLILAIRLYHPSLPVYLIDYIQCPYRPVIDKFLLVGQHHRGTSLMSSSLLLKQCSTCLVRLIWMVWEVGDRCPYSCCGMLLPGFVQYRSLHSGAVPVKLFLCMLCQRPCGASIYIYIYRERERERKEGKKNN